MPAACMEDAESSANSHHLVSPLHWNLKENAIQTGNGNKNREACLQSKSCANAKTSTSQKAQFKANTRCFLFASVADNFYVSSMKTTSDLSNLPKTKAIKKKDFGAAP